MLQNNTPASLPSIEKFISRLSTAERTQQKEIRLTIQEARDLCNDLALITSKLNTTLQEINSNLKKLTDSTTKIDVKFDGGAF
jgi:uncharacterized FlaG/YvyC family protein